MSSVYLAEAIVTLIEAKIKADIAGELSTVRTERADAKVTTEPPRYYFRYSGAKAYQAPCVFTICDSVDLKLAERGANHIAAQARVLVAVLVEDRILDNLVLKSWRYQSALHKILHLTSLTSGDGRVRLFVKVARVNFSPEFSGTEDRNAPQSVFRKEVSLELEVEHNENL